MVKAINFDHPSSHQVVRRDLYTAMTPAMIITRPITTKVTKVVESVPVTGSVPGFNGLGLIVVVGL